MAEGLLPTSRKGVPTASRLVYEARHGRWARRPDELAVEEPLEIRLGRRGLECPEVLTVTMRTPGHDFELAVGWALSEGILEGAGGLGAVRYCTDPELDTEQRYNVVTLDLAAGGTSSRPPRLTATSSVCGSASIEALTGRGLAEVTRSSDFALEGVLGWPDLLREKGQGGFSLTGGLHAAGLVSDAGELLVAREDIGRHNAVDKVIGWAVLQAVEGRLTLPLSALGLVLSGRSSFEIVSKALAAGIPLIAAVSAASSLAVRLAEEKNLSLLGFVRDGRCTVYTHRERLRLPPAG